MQTPWIDLQYLQRISGNDDDFCRDILALFADKGKTELHELKEQMEQGLFDEMEETVHRMRSSYTSVKASKAADVLKELEQYLAEGRGMPPAFLWSRVFESCTQTIEQASTLMQKS